MSTLLEVNGLRKAFGGLQAVAGVSLTLGEGEMLGVIGPNGSGKSTLFNLISGVIPPDSGSVRLQGRECAGLKPHRIARLGLARTFQIATPFRKLTVRENLWVAGLGLSGAEAHSRAQGWLDFLKLAHVADNLAEDLSGGQQKLLELGRALMLEPRCILLDEVAAGVNPVLTQEIAEHVRELNRTRKVSFLVIEHDMELIRDLCPRVIVMERGEQLAEGSFAEVTANPQVIEAYLGRDES